MSNCLNKVILMGNLVAKPEIQSTQSGTVLSRFRIAVGRAFSKKDAETNTDFISCVCFGKTAEFVSSYFEKGQGIAIVGSLRTSSYTDGEGKKRYSVEVLCGEVYFTGAKQSGQNEASQRPIEASLEELSDDEDLPF